MRACYLLIILSLALVAAADEAQIQEYLTEDTDIVLGEQPGTDYVLVLDRSGSMRGEKITSAKEAAQRFIEGMGGDDRTAIVSFDSKTQLHHGLSNDKTSLQRAVQSIQVGDFTQYGPALEQAQRLFDDENSVIVFLSDGRPDDETSQLQEQAHRIAKEGTCLFSIAYAQSENNDATEILREFASISQEETGCGSFFSADEEGFELGYIFSSIYQVVSSQEVFDVESSVTQQEGVRINIEARSTFNGRPIFGSGVLEPYSQLTIRKDGDVVYDRRGDDTHVMSLSEGTYEYSVRVLEDCHGTCLYSGEDSGTFSVTEDIQACVTPWEQLVTQLKSTERIEIAITASGFDPQSIGTEGIVTWKNIDKVPHKVLSLDGSFESPVLEPGESWTHAFPPGDYTYTDTFGSFQGLVNNDEDAHEPVDLVLVIDTSGSMAGAPLKEAQLAAASFIQLMSPEDRVSIISFSEQARIHQSLSGNKAAIEHAVRGLHSEGSTFYKPALNKIFTQLQQSNEDKHRVVIFLSDGVPFDAGGKDAILNRLHEGIGDACLYTIGYGREDPRASELLSEMAVSVRERNDCGAYYFSEARKQELSSVFGEIYASTQRTGLELYDTQTSLDGDTVVFRTRVRSADNGLSVPTRTGAECIPEAQVTASMGGQSTRLLYNGDVYEGSIEGEPGSYLSVVSAKLSNEENPLEAAVGSTSIRVNIASNRLAWMIAGVLLVLFIIILNVFMLAKRRPTHEDGDIPEKTRDY